MLTTRTKIALARLIQRPLMMARRLFGLGPEITVRRRGVRWRLDLREGIDLSIYLLGAFEPSTLKAFERLVEPGMTVLDIGANVGAHTLHLARLVGDRGRVHAFEPTDWAMGKLRANLDLNPELAARVTPVQAFLVDRPDRAAEAEVHASWPVDGHGVHPRLRAQKMPAAGARATTLDDWLAEAGVGQVDVIKLDVDGHESQVLAGAHTTLSRLRPVLVMELSPYVHDERGGSFEHMLEQLLSLGYRLYRLADGALILDDPHKLAAAIPAGAGVNVLIRADGEPEPAKALR